MEEAGYLHQLADALGLSGWEFLIGDRAPIAPNAHAAVSVVWGQRRATIFLAPDFAALPPETQRRCLVHELLHVWADPLREVVANLSGVLGGPAHDVASRCHADAEERMVDGIATAVAALLPLPEGDGDGTG